VDKVLLIKREFTKSMLKSSLAKSLKVKQFFENPKNGVWINTCASWIKKMSLRKIGYNVEPLFSQSDKPQINLASLYSYTLDFVQSHKKESQ
jgi:hypothetical protein